MGLTLKPEAWQGPPRESEAEERTASRSRVPVAQAGPARGSAGVAGGAWENQESMCLETDQRTAGQSYGHVPWPAPGWVCGPGWCVPASPSLGDTPLGTVGPRWNTARLAQSPGSLGGGEAQRGESQPWVSPWALSPRRHQSVPPEV